MTDFADVLRQAEAREGPGWLERHSRMLLNSYRHWTSEALEPALEEGGCCAEALFEAPLVVLSSRADDEQTLNYGNAAALRLWRMEWAVLTKMPSRLTAEPAERATREAFLQRVRQQGVIRDYCGVRVTSDGRRFRIERAVVWNLLDAKGHHHGQAAAFRDWSWL